MSRINTNISSMIAGRNLATQNSRLSTSLQRLSTGLRINTGKDDPAGLIASENLRSEQVALKAAVYNISRANSVVSVAESALNEVNTLLTQLDDLVGRSSNSAGISEDEKAANQLQIDSILQSINRVASSTEFQGKKLLNGELGYQTSGINATNITHVDVQSARIANGQTRTVAVEVTGSAQLAALAYAGSTVGSTAVTLEIVGAHGSDTLSFGASANVSAVAAAVNETSDLTGVTATVNGSGTGLTFNSQAFGSSQFVTVRTLTGTFAVTGGTDNTDYGVDVQATVNGVSAAGDGLRLSARSSTLSVDLDLSATFAQTLGSDTFSVVGGGANFQISPTIELAGRESLGITSVSTGSLGNLLDGFLSSLASGGSNALNSNNFEVAQRVVRNAQDQISGLRGRLGSFQKNTLETTSNALAVTLENLTAAESTLRDTDFAEETSTLTRQQILVQSATNVLRIANTVPQQALSLLQ